MPKGRTLYFFTNDADGASACEGGCEAAWPVFNAEDLTVGEGLEVTDFGSITHAPTAVSKRPLKGGHCTALPPTRTPETLAATARATYGLWPNLITV